MEQIFRIYAGTRAANPNNESLQRSELERSLKSAP